MAGVPSFSVGRCRPHHRPLPSQPSLGVLARRFSLDCGYGRGCTPGALVGLVWASAANPVRLSRLAALDLTSQFPILSAEFDALCHTSLQVTPWLLLSIGPGPQPHLAFVVRLRAVERGRLSFLLPFLYNTKESATRYDLTICPDDSLLSHPVQSVIPPRP